MPLILAENLSKTFAHRPLFQNVRMVLENNERVGLIGPNGAGKSTLLKILCGLEITDTGKVTKQGSVRLAYVVQKDEFEPGHTVLQAAASVVDIPGYDEHQNEISAQIELSKAGFEDFDQPVESLSGGWRKRLAIARQIAREPDILMLDEPTNHLDLEGVQWLEEYLKSARMCVVVITHDRYFLENACNRIVELSRAYPDGTFSVDGSYTKFLERKADFLFAQEKLEKAIAVKVRDDIAYMRQGIKARGTRSKSRVAAVHENASKLAEVKARNKQQGAAGVEFSGSGRKTTKLVEAIGIKKSLGGKCLFKNLDLLLTPGSCLGLVGANGTGKTTLLRLLTQQLEPDAGQIKWADNLKIITYTQHREALDPKMSLKDALCPDGDRVPYRGQMIHVASWAQRFLFDPQQMRVSVGDLSGGEQSRVQLASMMQKEADLLILDEPTNDLDIPTLEVLEESIASFEGAVILVTHDRYLLDRVSTEVLYLDGNEQARSFASYSQLVGRLEQEAIQAKEELAQRNQTESTSTNNQPKVDAPKLTYNEQRELDNIEHTILQAEDAFQAAQAKASDPDILNDHEVSQKVFAELAQAQTHIQDLYIRWEKLEAKKQAYLDNRK